MQSWGQTGEVRARKIPDTLRSASIEEYIHSELDEINSTNKSKSERRTEALINRNSINFQWCGY